MDEASKQFLREQLTRDPSLAHVVFQFDDRPRSEVETNRSLELGRILNRALRDTCDENYFDYNAR